MFQHRQPYYSGDVLTGWTLTLEWTS